MENLTSDHDQLFAAQEMEELDFTDRHTITNGNSLHSGEGGLNLQNYTMPHPHNMNLGSLGPDFAGEGINPEALTLYGNALARGANALIDVNSVFQVRQSHPHRSNNHHPQLSSACPSLRNHGNMYRSPPPPAAVVTITTGNQSFNSTSDLPFIPPAAISCNAGDITSSSVHYSGSLYNHDRPSLSSSKAKLTTQSQQGMPHVSTTMRRLPRQPAVSGRTPEHNSRIERPDLIDTILTTRKSGFSPAMIQTDSVTKAANTTPQKVIPLKSDISIPIQGTSERLRNIQLMVIPDTENRGRVLLAGAATADASLFSQSNLESGTENTVNSIFTPILNLQSSDTTDCLQAIPSDNSPPSGELTEPVKKNSSFEKEGKPTSGHTTKGSKKQSVKTVSVSKVSDKTVVEVSFVSDLVKQSDILEGSVIDSVNQKSAQNEEQITFAFKDENDGGSVDDRDKEQLTAVVKKRGNIDSVDCKDIPVGKLTMRKDVSLIGEFDNNNISSDKNSNFPRKRSIAGQSKDDDVDKRGRDSTNDGIETEVGENKKESPNNKISHKEILSRTEETNEDDSAQLKEVSMHIDDSQCVKENDQWRWLCHLCPKKYTSKHDLATHVLDHSGIKPHCCVICGHFFKQLNHLNAHMLSHGPHACTVCGQTFTHLSQLKQHMATHSGDGRPYACELCGCGFVDPGELKAHVDKHKTAAGGFPCKFCGGLFASVELLKQHIITHKAQEGIQCPDCSQWFQNTSELKDHMLEHCRKRPFICKECGMDFVKEQHLRSHMVTHTSLKPWICRVCERPFNHRANMLRHMLTHEEQKRFKCEKCGKYFSQPQTLKAHLVTHADKKPFQCNICGKEFSRSHNLQSHMHLHNNSKPFICFCGASFTLRGNLSRHKKVKHGISGDDEYTEEEAAEILNAMSERRLQNDRHGTHDGDAAEEYLREFREASEARDETWVPRRKQRKSTPRKQRFCVVKSKEVSGKVNKNSSEEHEDEGSLSDLSLYLPEDEEEDADDESDSADHGIRSRRVSKNNDAGSQGDLELSRLSPLKCSSPFVSLKRTFSEIGKDASDKMHTKLPKKESLASVLAAKFRQSEKQGCE